MTREEAINAITQFIENYAYGNDLIGLKMAIEALKEERPHGEWEYLKEHITEMRDADGKLNQKQTCQFILNLMGVIEKEGDENG